jgi:hypothetical protein
VGWAREGANGKRRRKVLEKLSGSCIDGRCFTSQTGISEVESCGKDIGDKTDGFRWVD